VVGNTTPVIPDGKFGAEAFPPVGVGIGKRRIPGVPSTPEAETTKGVTAAVRGVRMESEKVAVEVVGATVLAEGVTVGHGLVIGTACAWVTTPTALPVPSVKKVWSRLPLPELATSPDLSELVLQAQLFQYFFCFAVDTHPHNGLP
jgi:hypothetical protein